MKLVDLLKDKLMGMYIDVLKGDEVIKSVYGGMEGKAFVIETDEEIEEGEEVVLRLSFGGWNFIFPCKVQSKTSGIYILVPSDKVKIVEKRREKRVPTVVKCRIGESGGTILDVSYHGVRVLTLGKPSIGEELYLEVEGKGLKGTVKWVRKEEVDLRSVGLFLKDSPDWWMNFVKEKISRYIKALRRL